MALKWCLRSAWSRTRGWRHHVIQAVICVYIVIPFTVLLFPSIVSTLVFSTVSFYFRDLKSPHDAGLEAARQIDLKMSTGKILGLWHILPESFLEEMKPLSGSEYKAMLSSGSPIFIYLHGNSGTRGQATRVYTYIVLRGQGFHVITFDYGGYGDSDGEATEKNMVADAVFVYRWTKSLAKTSLVFLWGHSLGSSVAVQAAELLSDAPPDGIVLEGAFNNLNEVIDVYLLTLPYRPFPFLMWIFHNALSRMDVHFKTDQHITRVACPILMLHAEDDMVIPVHLARALFETAMAANRKDQPLITLHTFPANNGYGHNFMNRAPDLGDIVWQFVQTSNKSKHRT